MMERVKKTRLFENIIQQFMQKIENGEFKPGDKLPTERELVDQLGVSRSSIREALRAMELTGLVESKVGGGTFIKSINMDKTFSNYVQMLTTDNKFLLDMFIVRILLETYSARQAAKKRTEEHVAQLRHTIDLLKKEISSPEIRAAADSMFHNIIAQAAGNTALVSVLSLGAELLRSSIMIANEYVTIMDIISEHEAIFDAIERKDEKNAERLMRAHLKRAHDRTKFILKHR
ncbi:MAG: FadR family transcriptional regulator [Treponema sp.]|jgi:GntR family transcriptional repressor for pyruvate dehydrogenase complex|nr:FadR family transcriptional regulator [Treponema sp.]